MSQKTIKMYQGLGYEGTIATNSTNNLRGALMPFFNKTGARLPYGRAIVKTGTGNTNVILPATTGLVPYGVTVFNDFMSAMSLETPDQQGYEPDQKCTVLVRGGIDLFVYSATATNVDDPVYFRHANGVAGSVGVAGLGTFRSTANADYTLWSTARFVYTTSTPGISIINLGGF